LAAYQAKLNDLEALGAEVVAATVDDKASTETIARDNGLTYPIAYGVTPAQLADFDPWWADDHHGHYPQPLEFMVLRGGTLFGTLYASGPVGRMHVDEVITSITNRERRRLEQQAQAKP
jgi:peroxiredoxin